MSKRTVKVNKEEKFKLPGQKYATPPEIESLRLFYSSLFEEKGLHSKMATDWMVKHGLLSLALVMKINAFTATDGDVAREYPSEIYKKVVKKPFRLPMKRVDVSSEAEAKIKESTRIRPFKLPKKDVAVVSKTFKLPKKKVDVDVVAKKTFKLPKKKTSPMAKDASMHR